MSAYRGWLRTLAALGFRAVFTFVVLVWFWRPLVSLAAVLAVLVVTVAAVAVAVLVAVRALLVWLRGW